MSSIDPSGSPIFDVLDADERRDLFRHAALTGFEAGTVILEEGERTDGLWVLASGRCEVLKVSTVVLAELLPGAVFGEMAFFTDAPHAASVRCVTPVEAWRLSRESFGDWERRSPAGAAKVARAIVGILSERLRRMDEWTGTLLSEAAPQRRREWSEFRGKLYGGWSF